MGKEMAMSRDCFNKIILLCTLVLLPLHDVMASTFVEVLARFTGISSTPSAVKGTTFPEGNLWLSEIDKSGDYKAKPITSDGTYQSPLWISGNKILAVKENNKLVQLEIDGSKERILHTFSDFTILAGFDKNDANSILILQDSGPAVISLTSGQITLLSYDKKENSKDSDALARLKRINSRHYGNMQVFVEERGEVGARGRGKKSNKIHVEMDKKKMVIPCPVDCTQPALSEDGRLLVFVGP
jgi:hypothetical protein